MKVKDGILGFAIGDSLGVPVEFLSRNFLNEYPVVDMMDCGVHNQVKGTWSDDTSMILATIDGINNCNDIDYLQLMENFCLWINSQKYTPHGEVFDVGNTTYHALDNFLFGDTSPVMCGGNRVNDNGNGSLMRILPLAYYFFYNPVSDLEMSEVINNVSSLTHRHPISCMGCYLYTKFAISLLEGKNFNEAYNKLQKSDVSMYSDEVKNVYKRVLSGELNDIKTSDDIKSSGYVVDTLEASLWCCLTGVNYETSVLKAVNLGEDTDTIGALTGGLCGIKYGITDIPEKWLNCLVKKDYIEDLCVKFENALEHKKVVFEK